MIVYRLVQEHRSKQRDRWLSFTVVSRTSSSQPSTCVMPATKPFVPPPPACHPGWSTCMGHESTPAPLDGTSID